MNVQEADCTQIEDVGLYPAQQAGAVGGPPWGLMEKVK